MCEELFHSFAHFGKPCYLFLFFLWKLPLPRPKPLQQRTNKNTQTKTHTHNPNPSSQPLTWQHVIKSLPHMEQVNGSTVCYVYLLLPKGTINVEISNIKFHCPNRDSNPDWCGDRQTC